VAFLFKQSSMASFVLYFLKERDEKETVKSAFIKSIKQRRPVAFLFKQSSMASFVLTFLKEGSAHDGFIKRLKQRRPVA